MAPNANMSDNTFAKVDPKTLSNIYDTGFLSDITVLFGGRKKALHKSILEKKSPIMKAEIMQRTKQGLGNVLELRCPSPKYVEPLEGLLLYCYTEEYPECPDESNLHWNLYVHYLAQHYDISNLRESSAERFREAISAFCKKSDEDKVFNYLKRAINLRTQDAASGTLLKSTILKTFKFMVEKLEIEDKPKEALERMRQNPKATAEMFNTELPSSGKIAASKDWRCRCGTVFLYLDTPKRQDLELPLCPCCSDSDGPVLNPAAKRKFIKIDE